MSGTRLKAFAGIFAGLIILGGFLADRALALNGVHGTCSFNLSNGSTLYKKCNTACPAGQVTTCEPIMDVTGTKIISGECGCVSL
jgi:hypothetical protein